MQSAFVFVPKAVNLLKNLNVFRITECYFILPLRRGLFVLTLRPASDCTDLLPTGTAFIGGPGQRPHYAGFKIRSDVKETHEEYHDSG